MLVRWNEPYQKLATCDVTGIIFVWIKHDGRWSIELINDRSSQVEFCSVVGAGLACRLTTQRRRGLVKNRKLQFSDRRLLTSDR